MSKNNLYTENSIQSISPLEFTRLRPGTYCGSTEYSTQPLIEIVSNAVDEFKAGHGNTIKIDIKKLHEDAVIPSYAHDGDIGMDMVATSMEYNEEKDYFLSFKKSFFSKVSSKIEYKFPDDNEFEESLNEAAAVINALKLADGGIE